MITIVYVLGAGSLYPHYLFLAAIEVVSLLLIIWYAWRRSLGVFQFRVQI